jgi:hypothetical protein
MDLPPDLPDDVLAFIETEIDSVPHMEALLLLWESAPNGWTVPQIGARLYVGDDTAGQIVADLVRRRLVRPPADAPERFAYDPEWDPGGDRMARIASAYRRHLIPIALRIHAKASGAVREFARAFEIKKKDG